MDSTILQYLVLPLWFSLAATVLYFLACVYAHLLCALDGRSVVVRVVFGGLLWLTFAGVFVAPLFGWIALERAYFPLFEEAPAMLWPFLCFGLCFFAVHRAMKARIRQLQSAGFFLK
jgi:hypothetical protein